MKINKKMTLRAGAALIALAGATTALSFVVTEANAKGAITTEDAYRISFKGGTSDASLPINGLTESMPAYKTITVDWNFSSGVKKGSVVATFELANNSSTHDINVLVSDVAWNQETTPDHTITPTDSRLEYILTNDTTAATTESSIYLKLLLIAKDTSAASEEASPSLGSLKVTLSYKEAAAQA